MAQQSLNQVDVSGDFVEVVCTAAPECVAGDVEPYRFSGLASDLP